MNLIVALRILLSVDGKDEYLYDKYPLIKCREEFKYLEGEGLIDRIADQFHVTKEGQYVIDSLRERFSEEIQA